MRKPTPAPGDPVAGPGRVAIVAEEAGGGGRWWWLCSDGGGPRSWAHLAQRSTHQVPGVFRYIDTVDSVSTYIYFFQYLVARFFVLRSWESSWNCASSRVSGIVIDDRGYKRYNLNYLNIISGSLSCINQLLLFVWLQFTTLTHSLKYTAKIKFCTFRPNEGKSYVRQEQNLMQSSRSPPQFLPAISDPLPPASAATWCGGTKQCSKCSHHMTNPDR